MFAKRVLAAVVLLAAVSGAWSCPEAQGWYISPITNMCYRTLRDERLNYADAQRKCNSLRSNLFQFKAGDTKDTFDNLQQELYETRNTSEFREQAWIGLTDRRAVEQFVYLNGFPLNSIAPDTLIACPRNNANCLRTNRCVYLDLNNRGSPSPQVYKGDCERTLLPPMCYAPRGGTDVFDPIPALGAASIGAWAGLTALCLAAAWGLPHGF